MAREGEDIGLRWEDGDLPVSALFDDPFYSRTDGLAEARHVFLAGNDLPRRWARPGPFQIAELGFGTGLNCLATAAMWETMEHRGRTLLYTSFELYPLPPSQTARALGCWPEHGDLAARLAEKAPDRCFELIPGFHVEIIVGDAREHVPAWPCIADAWYLDGFAPARNPELWEPGLLQAVYDHTAPEGTFATYSAAGAVRRGLITAGFDVTRRPGFGTKREMLSGRRQAPR
ncbi:MAG: tRNA (5-methylaminomethyl-2-thiouridine)(34)-methyltransferase MnmD [Pseudomonadota bacterium]